MKALVGKKIGMTQVFAENGKKTAVTVLDVSEVVVSKHLREGGEEVSHIELGQNSKRKPNKADSGNYKAIGLVPAFKAVFKVDQSDIPEVGTKVSADVFEIGDKVDLIGISKGKGFQGGMKRWGFKGGPATHGGPTGKMRAIGSIGSGTTPGRVVKGKKMPGRMGGKGKTVQGLKVVQVDAENGLIAVSGGIPGANGSYLVIRKSNKYK